EGKLGSFNTAYSTSSNITPANDQCPLDGTEERAVDLPYIAMLKQWSTADPVSQREIDEGKLGSFNTAYSTSSNITPANDQCPLDGTEER
ncbi:hypothetical protein BOQ60_25705, partial [Chryseobacterium sp. CH1]